MVRRLDGLQERTASYSRRRIKHRNVRFLAFPVFQRGGAPEEIRTPDPQIRSLAPLFDPSPFFCKPGGKAGQAYQWVSRPTCKLLRMAPAWMQRAPPVLFALGVLQGSVGVFENEPLSLPQRPMRQQRFSTLPARASPPRPGGQAASAADACHERLSSRRSRRPCDVDLALRSAEHPARREAIGRCGIIRCPSGRPAEHPRSTASAM